MVTDFEASTSRIRRILTGLISISHIPTLVVTTCPTLSIVLPLGKSCQNNKIRLQHFTFWDITFLNFKISYILKFYMQRKITLVHTECMFRVYLTEHLYRTCNNTVFKLAENKWLFWTQRRIFKPGLKMEECVHRTQMPPLPVIVNRWKTSELKKQLNFQVYVHTIE